MRIHFLSAAIGLSLAGCVNLEPGPTGRDQMVGGYLPDQFPNCRVHDVGPVKQIKCLRAGETLDEMTDQLVLRTLRRNGTEPTVVLLAQGMLDRRAKACRDFESKFHETQETPVGDLLASTTREWSQRECQGEHNDHSIARMMYARETIFEIIYRTNSRERLHERSEEWRKLLAEATVVTNPTR